MVGPSTLINEVLVDIMAEINLWLPTSCTIFGGLIRRDSQEFQDPWGGDSDIDSMETEDLVLPQPNQWVLATED